MRRRSGFAVLLLSALLAAIAVAPAWADPVGQPVDIERIVRRGTLVVAMTQADAPPFHKMTETGLTGVDVDLAQGLARALGVAVVFDRTAKSYDEVVDIVVRGQADIAISKLSRTLLRARAVKFSSPYLTLRHGMALNRVWLARATREHDLSEVIRGFDGRLGVVAKTSYVEYAPRLFPHAEIVEFPRWDEAVAALVRGEVAALYRDEFEIRRLVIEHPELALHLKTAFLTDTRDHLCMAVNPRDTQLLQLADIFIDDQNPKLTVETVLGRLGKAAPKQGDAP